MTTALAVSDPDQLGSVNQHYLAKVMDLAEEKNVAATEDIYDARGNMLVAKGTRISGDLQEKLILRKLRKPLEATIAVEDGANANTIAAEAKRIAESMLPVQAIVKEVHGIGRSPFDILGKAKIGSAMSMMLTITERGGASALSHSVLVSLLSICLAKRIGMPERDQETAALAGLLHDIGELYIEPQYLHSAKRLLPHEWRHVVVHPRIGQMLISELDDYPPAVAIAVSEHHERFDGSGYPKQTAGSGISIVGQTVSVAETIAGVFTRQDQALQRAELALKIIPGEHRLDLVSAVARARSSAGDAAQKADRSLEEAHQTIQRISGQMDAIRDTAQALLDKQLIQSKKGKEIVQQALHQLQVISRAFCSTGLYAYAERNETLLKEAHNIETLFEIAVVSKEIHWRMRDIARNLALLAATLESGEASAMQPLIDLIDKDVES